MDVAAGVCDVGLPWRSKESSVSLRYRPAAGFLAFLEAEVGVVRLLRCRNLPLQHLRHFRKMSSFTFTPNNLHTKQPNITDSKLHSSSIRPPELPPEPSAAAAPSSPNSSGAAASKGRPLPGLEAAAALTAARVPPSFSATCATSSQGRSVPAGSSDCTIWPYSIMITG